MELQIVALRPASEQKVKSVFFNRLHGTGLDQSNIFEGNIGPVLVRGGHCDYRDL